MSELSKRLYEKYNIKFHIHQFRAGFVNDSYEAGNDLPTTQRLVGHENISTTERHYLNVGDKHLQEAAQRMPSFTTATNTSNQCHGAIDIVLLLAIIFLILSLIVI